MKPMPIVRYKTFILFACTFFMLTACSMRPSSEESVGTVNPKLIAQHQAHLDAISSWQIRGRMAFFDLTEDKRNTASLSWAKNSQESSLRLSHPLRGTIAQLQQTPEGATLIDLKGEAFHARHIDELLYWQLGFKLPFSLVENAITGKQPRALASQFSYYPDGSIAQYKMLSANSPSNSQGWLIQLSRYQDVETATGIFKLPHALEVTHRDYNIRLQITNWSRIE